MDADQLSKLGIEALKKALRTVDNLGEKGLAMVQKNPCGDMSLMGDIEAENAVIETFRKARIPIKIISEEHGELDIAENPVLLAVLDGLDGTKEYKKSRKKGRYGTMLGIFSNLNPKYDNYVFSGVMEHSTRKLFHAAKGKGSFILINGKEKPISCSSAKHLIKGKTIIYADEEFDKNRNITLIQDTFLSKLKGYKYLSATSSAVHYVDLASGKADLVLECTRKRNLEIATAYGLVTESGGIMTTLDGISLQNRRYLQFGQKEFLPVISASSKELVKALIINLRD